MAQDQGGPNVEGIKLTILKSGGGGVKMNKLSALEVFRVSYRYPSC